MGDTSPGLYQHLFQWESQNAKAERSATGQRYINHRALGSSVHLFVHESKMADGTLGTPPYLFAEPMITSSPGQ